MRLFNAVLISTSVVSCSVVSATFVIIDLQSFMLNRHVTNVTCARDNSYLHLVW